MLNSHPKPVSPGYIKDVMLDKGRDLTRLVDKLVKLGYVERSLCESNRRKMEISITESGSKIIDLVEQETQKIYAGYNLSDEEALTLSNLLDKVREQ